MCEELKGYETFYKSSSLRFGIDGLTALRLLSPTSLAYSLTEEDSKLSAVIQRSKHTERIPFIT